MDIIPEICDYAADDPGPRDLARARGEVQAVFAWADGSSEVLAMPNTILLTGRRALAKSLANIVGDGYSFFVARMIFGNGGTQNGTPRYVDDSRNGLYGLTIVSKGIIASIDSTIPSQAVFTSVIGFNEGNNATLNEMALQMANGDLYSMRTFPDLNKTNQMQITFNWKINFI